MNTNIDTEIDTKLKAYALYIENISDGYGEWVFFKSTNNQTAMIEADEILEDWLTDSESDEETVLVRGKWELCLDTDDRPTIARNEFYIQIDNET